ncbi:MAG TPA: DNA/RNA helicase domain-containing protein [Gammaproteobacteria bacterium]|nr:DNA/RNA helicase domain-containing protein [Gammaproteobacteria bacterium]
MIVYSSTRTQFVDDVRANRIHKTIHSELQRKLSMRVSEREVLAWRNSMHYMAHLLADEQLPADSNVYIEYSIPLTNKRVDFILTGQDAERTDTAVLVELKQWSDVQLTKKDAIVRTTLGGALVETSHPSYQVWTYAALIRDFNEAVREEGISLVPCAYLHNLDQRDVIEAPFYAEHLKKAPVFISNDSAKLAAFLKKNIRYGDANKLMYHIENGKIRPSRSLADALVSMMKGNQEFLMIDDQKLVFETALDIAYHARKSGKQVLIVEGGPGTGKSVVAINLLVALTDRDMLVQYVSKNAAPRAVYEAKLTGTFKKSEITNLFKGSGSFTETQKGLFDVLIVDEAHRLNEKSGLYGNKGENQIKELIHASKATFFFIDEDQRISLKDIGHRAAIKDWAKQLGAKVTDLKLESQFRCGGSDGYLAWIDDVLQVRDSANADLAGIEFDFKVFDNPNALREEIVRKNAERNSARLVAGYCWDWNSRDNSSAMDIVIPKYGFEAQWNLSQDGSLWIISPTSVKEVGCIHTCQGLEVDYIGVIVGPDLMVRDGKVISVPTARSRMDASIKGYKSMVRADPAEAAKRGDLIVKNTYRTLMTRGMKGCYIYCTDEETGQYFRDRLKNLSQIISDAEIQLSEFVARVLPFKILERERVRPYQNCVPVLDLKVAAGYFSESSIGDPNEVEWAELPDAFRVLPGLFIAQVVGESMNRVIPNGSWCLFRANPPGSRNGKIVLVESRGIADPEHGGSYTLKRYRSWKNVSPDDTWEHSRIELMPESFESRFAPIVLDGEKAGELRVIAEYVAIL